MKPILILSALALLSAGCDGTGNARNRAEPSRPVARARTGVDWTNQVAATPEGGFRMGNPNARVKLVEFGSMTCHVCRDFSAQSAPGLQTYVRGGQVSYEFRNFLRDPYDVVASLLARCGGPRPFFKLTEQVFTEQDAFIARAQAITPAQSQQIGALTPAQQFVRLGEATGLTRFVGQRGIPAARANACLANKAELDRLVAMTDTAGRTYNISGTPTFLINGRTVGDTVSWAQLEPQIKAALGR